MNAQTESLPSPPGATATSVVGTSGPNPALLIALAWVLIVLQLLIVKWGATAETLYDTDDAMRLVEMRAFLSGRGWFDLREMRIAPPFGYVSHWSRLIDAGLAGLFLFFKLFTDTANAERLMRVTWPLLWLLPSLCGVAAVAQRLAGREGVWLALLLAVLGLAVYGQFLPGRIDHHNVQIALTMLALAATIWSDRVRWAAVAAGLATALAMAIGFECLPFLIICAAAMSLRFVFDADGARPLAHYGLSLAAGTALALAVNLPPARWFETACDALAINTAAPVILAGVLLTVVVATTGRRARLVRFGAMSAVGALVAAAYVALEPRCLGGPYAMMDPAVWSLWLGRVREMQPLWVTARVSPDVAVVLGTFPLVGLISGCVLARDAKLRRDFACLVVAGALLTSFVLMLATLKMYAYAQWIALPAVALAGVRLWQRLKLTVLLARVAVALLLSPAVVTVLAIGVVHVAVPGSATEKEDGNAVCSKIASYAPLKRLPAGLVAANIDFGPHILALTQHSVISGPYHRLSEGIIETHRVFASVPEEAMALVKQLGVTYVAICGPNGPVGLTAEARKKTLWGQLDGGTVPDWLERLPEEPGQAFAIYRVRP